MRFVGKTGLFTPMEPGSGGGFLVRVKDDKKFAVSNTTGFQWLESEVVANSSKKDFIDGKYFEKLVDDAIDQIKKFGDYEWFVS